MTTQYYYIGIGGDLASMWTINTFGEVVGPTWTYPNETLPPRDKWAGMPWIPTPGPSDEIVFPTKGYGYPLEGSISVASALVRGNVSGLDGSITVSHEFDDEGLFLLQSGGVTVNADGANPGNLDVGSSIAMPGSTGTFVQNHGDVTVGSGVLLAFAGGSGTYQLGGGTVSASFEIIGGEGFGSFQQSGNSTNTVAGVLTLGRSPVGQGGNGSGNYLLAGPANLQAGTETIGDAGQGTFQQSGASTNAVMQGLTLGSQEGAVGNYYLSGTSLLSVGTNEAIGVAGHGLLDNLGGENTVGGILLLGVNGSSPGFGQYILHDKALLSASSFVIGDGGNGQLTINSGSAAYSSATLDANVAPQPIFNGYAMLGVQTNSSGEIDVNDAGSTFEALGEGLIVGNGGSAKLAVQNGGSVHTTNLDAGVLPSNGISSVTIFLSGPATDSSGASTLDTLAVDQDLILGVGGNVRAEINGGASVTASDIETAVDQTSQVRLDIAGQGTVVTALDDNPTGNEPVSGIGIGIGGLSQVLVRDGAVLESASAIALGVNGGQGALSVTTGALVDASDLLVGVKGSGAIQIGSGGTVAAESITLGSDFGGRGLFAVSGAGIATAGQDLTMHSGSLLDVSGGGAVDVGSGRLPVAGVVQIGASGELTGAGTINGTVVVDPGGLLEASDGTLAIAGPLAGSALITNHSTLELGDRASSGIITFGGTGETLQIDRAMPTDVIKGFAIGDTIDLAGVPYVYGKVGTTAGIAILSPDNELNVTEGGVSYHLSLDPTDSFRGQSFTLSPDGKGGTDVKLVQDPTLLEYLLFSALSYDLTTSTPPKFSNLDGFTLGPATVSNAGLTALTFVDNTAGTPEYKDVVVAFRGSVTSHDWFVSDVQLALGFKPAEFDAAVNFVTQQIETAFPVSEGFSYFVTGHSLGAAEAEDVAAVLGLGGDTFAAPGVSRILTAGGVLSNGANLTDYNITNDPVANHTALSGQHVGNVVPLSPVNPGADLFGLLEHPITNYGQALVNAQLISPPNPLPIPSQPTSPPPTAPSLKAQTAPAGSTDITPLTIPTDLSSHLVQQKVPSATGLPSTLSFSTLSAAQGDGANSATTLFGGHDNFLFRSDFATNKTTEFNVQMDALQFDDATLHNLRGILAYATDASAGTVISDGYGDSITLAGGRATQLHTHEHDFHLV